MRALVILPLLLLALPASAAPEAPLRLAFEGGVAWYHAFPDERIGPAGTLRLRGQLTERFLAGIACSHLRQPSEGGTRASTLLPLTLDVRIDRAPVAPFAGGGIAAIHVDGVGLDFGAVLEAGLEWELGESWALSAQATYAGHRQATVFPYFSSFTVGLAAGLL